MLSEKLVRIANKEDSDLHCLYMPFWQITIVQILELLLYVLMDSSFWFDNHAINTNNGSLYYVYIEG